MNVRPALLVLAFAFAACNSPAEPPKEGGRAEEDLPPPEFFVEEPVGSDRWKDADALPAWVESPPRRDGVSVFVLDSASNLRHIALVRSDDHNRRAVGKTVAAALGKATSAENAAKGGDAAAAALRLVSRATREERTTMRMVPGNSLVTVWSLWELPHEPVLAALPEADRAAARAALASIPPR